MRIAFASGKGGTGKTTFSVSLSIVANNGDNEVVYLDCDVEEPNGSIFLKPVIKKEEKVLVLIPTVNEDDCVGCGKCNEICNFNAIAVAGGTAMVFTEMCHSCGGCEKICPTGAITEYGKNIGVIKFGKSGTLNTVEGRLDVGYSLAPPIIRAVKNSINDEKINIIDCPPGTSCSMVETIKGSDFVVLVTEPTPFGLNDLILAVETVKILNLPFGVIINRSDSGDERVLEYCRKNNINILMELPESREIAEKYSRGQSILDDNIELKTKFNKLFNDIKESVRGVK